MDTIKKEIESIDKRLSFLTSQIHSIYDIEDRKERFKKLDEIFEEERIIIDRKYELEKELHFLLPPTKSNGIIDLREDSKYCYRIYISNTKIEIGHIRFRGYHTNDFSGDIGYSIFKEYRGNNYAYQALTLLSEKLYEDGISDFWVGIYSNNIPSIKTVEKYGGVLKKDNNGALLFECTTQKRKNLDETIIVK